MFSLTRIFPYKDRICNSVLMPENKSQRKPIFWYVFCLVGCLSNVVFVMFHNEKPKARLKWHTNPTLNGANHPFITLVKTLNAKPPNVAAFCYLKRQKRQILKPSDFVCNRTLVCFTALQSQVLSKERRMFLAYAFMSQKFHLNLYLLKSN